MCAHEHEKRAQCTTKAGLACCISCCFGKQVQEVWIRQRPIITRQRSMPTHTTRHTHTHTPHHNKQTHRQPPSAAPSTDKQARASTAVSWSPRPAPASVQDAQPHHSFVVQLAGHLRAAKTTRWHPREGKNACRIPKLVPPLLLKALPPTRTRHLSHRPKPARSKRCRAHSAHPRLSFCQGGDSHQRGHHLACLA